jgi:hypothetical protein
MDRTPRFPLPVDFVQDFANPHQFGILDSITIAWNTSFVNLTDITVVLSTIAKMSQYINDIDGYPLIWQDEWFMSLRFLPIFHQLLCLPRDNLDKTSLNPEMIIREAVRLACITLFSIMNRKFRISPDGITRYRSRIMNLLIKFPVPWFPFHSLRLWVLSIAGLVSVGKEREWYIGEILNTMEQLGIASWNEVLMIVKAIVWVDGLLDEEVEKLGLEVTKSGSLILS